MTLPQRIADSYDAVIVGAGAAGGVVAGVLAESGCRVLLVERGPRRAFEGIPRDHLRNQRLPLYGNNSGPADPRDLRVALDPFTGVLKLAAPHDAAYENNAAGVGGGTQVWGAQAWRYMPQDFRMASLYGVPSGSSLADWPIGYDDLAPYYDRAEWEIGVAGDGDASARCQNLKRERAYPLPPVPTNPSGEKLRAGAGKLGWRTMPVPLAINTRPYLGRAACAECSYCVGFACPTDAKNGSQNTLIPRALATRLCDLVTGAMAERIEVSHSGDVTGVSLLLTSNASGTVERKFVAARAVVVSGGAIESARLLLNSTSPLHPRGLGNAHDLVGRNLDGHLYTGALGLFDDVVQDTRGPGVSIATCEFNHGNPDGIIGGAMMANEFTKTPILFWRWAWPPDLPRWGMAAKEYMRRAYLRAIHVNCPVHNIPNPDSRVQIDSSVRDQFGIPVARISGGVHPETLRAADFMRRRAEEWLRGGGAAQVWSRPPAYGRSAGQHQAGQTCGQR